MKQISVLLLILFIFFMSLVGCQDNSQETNARTYYDSLALDTPEETVREFVDAFQRDDFFTVFLILSPSTQFRTEHNIEVLKYEELIKVNDLENAREILADTPQFRVRPEWEQGGAVASYLFDSIMLAAKDQSALLIDLSGDISVLQSETGSDTGQIDVFATVEGIEGDVIFRMEHVCCIKLSTP